MICDLKYEKGTVINQEEHWESTSKMLESHVQRPWGKREWFGKKAIERSKGEHMSEGRMCLEQAGLCWPLKVLKGFILKGCERDFMGWAVNCPSTPVTI